MNRERIRNIIYNIFYNMTFEEKFTFHERNALDKAIDIMANYEITKAELINDVYNKCCILMYNIKSINLSTISEADLTKIISDYEIESASLIDEFNNCIEKAIIRYKSITHDVCEIQHKLNIQMTMYVTTAKEDKLVSKRMLVFNGIINGICSSLDKAYDTEYNLLIEIEKELQKLKNYTTITYDKKSIDLINESNKNARQQMLKIFNYKDMIKLAKEHNYREVRYHGDHLILLHNETNKMVVIPAHNLGYGLMIKIQKQIKDNKYA